MESIKSSFDKLRKNKTFKYGMPFFILVIGGSFGLREFAQLRFQFSKKQMIKPEELEEQGIIMKKPGEVTLESEFNKIIAGLIVWNSFLLH
ncbi:cytochrome c oxidase assembly protein COX16 homolog l(3)neo43 isoform X2 [Rhodnius prolixus]|uniref:cytochrome c oxidase assembly protein COX16 homolog l(3)neo43 isoform X2 n=1 Tax=Rhodnius prolixus TaxID=13249 RepID=UPI003D188E3F